MFFELIYTFDIIELKSKNIGEEETILIKTYSFKLYSNKRNKHLHNQIRIAARIYNHCIALHKRYYKMYGEYLPLYKLLKHITKLKKTSRFSYWNGLGSQAIQDVAERIDRAYKLFFKNLKRKVRTAPPSFKKSVKYKSFTLKQAGYKILDDNRVQINGKIYRYFKSREIEGKIKTVTVKRDTLGDIYVFIVCEQEQPQIMARTGEMVGYDFGLKTFLKASDGYDIESPLFFKQNAARIAKLNRSLSRKVKGSNNRRKARKDLARAHKRIANMRKDFHFKLAAELCADYAFICIEDLNIKAMQRMWGRKISDLSHSQFVQILKYQAAKCGTTIVDIPRFYPSSKTCSKCGYIVDELPLSVRSWVCPECKSEHDRDYNAAVNISRVGASTLGRDIVSPAI